MLLFYGRRSARIRRYPDKNHACKECGTFDLDVAIFRDYYQLFFIPVFPFGSPRVKITCCNCGRPYRSDALQNHYENITKTPFFLYSLPLALALLFLLLINAHFHNKTQTAAFVESPKVGDVYRIRTDEHHVTKYRFFKVAQVWADTVVVFANNLDYYSFPLGLSDSDYFVKNDVIIFTRAALKQMLDNDQINGVERNYGEEQGFNRLK